MTTALDVMTRAGRALGYLGRTQIMSAGDANDGINTFNALLDSWSNESLMSYVILQRSFTLQAMQQTYTIGTGGVINSVRPYEITSAFVRDSSQLDYGMEIYNRSQWDNIGEKNITSQIPQVLFYDSQYPLGIINIFPLPLVNYTIFFNSTTNQVDMSTMTQVLSLPVGYERAIILNLALEFMSAGFPCLLDDKALARLITNAAEAKGNIKRANIKLVVADYDQAIVSRSYASYNIYSDGPSRP